ncbi:hypothetical protein SpCBS45565_g01173 [Spizellomyces sp. 'palustris']|nr:hypothetical protein SpCBS45565_g01173 [Spizellomyces sp. 'palustris']
MEPVVVSALDLKRLQQKLEGVGVEERIRQMQKEDREERYRLSKARISRWDNTIAGQRRKRLQARSDRLATEEAERVRVDQEYAAEEAERRKAAIDRAKQLQYYQTDMVKNFHSKVVLFEALKERDMQVALKKERAEHEKKRDLESAREEEPKAVAARQAELHLQLEVRRRALQAQQDLLDQLRQKQAREAAETEACRREAETLSSLDEEFRQKQKEAAVKQRSQRAILRQELLNMKEELTTRNAADRELDTEESRKADEWADRKRQQNIKKKERERTWFNESQRMRQCIGEQTAKEDALIDAKIDVAVAKAMRDREEKVKRQEKEAAEKKRRQADELTTAYKSHIRRTEIQRKIQKEQDQEELKEYVRLNEQAASERKTRKQELLRKGKELQDVHLREIAVHTAQRAKDREEQLANDRATLAVHEHDDEKLHAYMKSLAAESWAQDNARLQHYVHDETSKPKDQRPWRLADKHWVDTGKRLGLTGNKYHPMDVAGTNEICRGDFLSVVGKATSRCGSAAGGATVVCRPQPSASPANSRPASSSTLISSRAGGHCKQGRPAILERLPAVHV